MLARLTDLLTGPSIVVPVDTVALASRTHVGPAPLPSPCSVDRLLETLSWAVAQVSAVVGHVAKVWDRVGPRLSELDDELTELERAAEPPAQGCRTRSPPADGPSTNSNSSARRSATRSRSRMRRWTSSPSRSNEPAPVPRHRRSPPRELVEAAARARSTIECIGAALDEADRAERDARDKILKAPSHSDELAAARTELARLVADLERGEARAAGDPSTGGRELAQLARQGDRLGRSVEQLREVIGTGLAERDELRGRLRGYRAVARAHGTGEDVARDELYQRATDLLYIAPCDLDAARRAVEAYQQSLSPTTTTEDR